MSELKEILNKSSSYLPIVVMILIFYFMIFRPQSKKRKAMEHMLNNLKIGDVIVTHGGIIGAIAKIEQNKIDIEVSPKTHISILKEAIARVQDESKPS